MVFADDEARTRLNGILHPRIGARTAELVAGAPDDAVVVHDVPLLVENGMGPAFALVLVVDAPEDVRVARLAETRGMAEDDARARIRAQATEDAPPGGRGRVDRQRRATSMRCTSRCARCGPSGSCRSRPALRARARGAVARGRRRPRPRRGRPRPAAWPRGSRSRAQDHVEGVEHVGPTAEPGRAAPDVIDLVVLATGGDRDRELGAALAGAGFPRWTADVHGGRTRAAGAGPGPLVGEGRGCSVDDTGCRRSRAAEVSLRARLRRT